MPLSRRPHRARRARRGLALAAVAALAAVLPPRGAAAQPAAQPPRNLQVLPKDIARDSLTQVMRGFTRALGVRCDYCHVQATPDFSRTPSNMGGWAWDRDDKLPKRTAREMIGQLTRGGVVRCRHPACTLRHARSVHFRSEFSPSAHLRGRVLGPGQQHQRI